MKLFVARKMTQNNTLNKVRVGATELAQLLSQNLDMVQLLKLPEKNEIVVSRGDTCLSAP